MLGDVGASRLPVGLFAVHARLENVPLMLDLDVPERVAQWLDGCGDVLVKAEGGVGGLALAEGLEAGCVF